MSERTMMEHAVKVEGELSRAQEEIATLRADLAKAREEVGLERIKVRALADRALAAERSRDEARADAKEQRENYHRAAGTIAEMYAAAMGHNDGPARGVVEDMADLRSRALAAERARDEAVAEVESLKQQREDLGVACATIQCATHQGRDDFNCSTCRGLRVVHEVRSGRAWSLEHELRQLQRESKDILTFIDAAISDRDAFENRLKEANLTADDRVEVECYRGHVFSLYAGWCPECCAGDLTRADDADARVLELERAIRDLPLTTCPVCRCPLSAHEDGCPVVDGEEWKNRALAAERSQDEARAEARAAHTPVCNYSHGPMFGPGCICVVTYKAQVAEWKAAETERDEARRELGAEQIAHAEAVVERDEAREALREAVALTAWAMVRGVMVTLSPGDHVALREWRERVLSGEKEGAK